MTSRKEGVKVAAAVAITEWTHDDFRLVAFGVSFMLFWGALERMRMLRLLRPRDEVQESTVCYLC